MRLALLLLALVACERATVVPLIGTPHTLQLDFAGCRPLAAATYDGDLWHLDTAGIRCDVPIEAGDALTGWLVFGRATGTPSSTACLEYLETVLTPEALHHRSVDCEPLHLTSTQGDAVAQGNLSPARPTSEDEAWSLRVYGADLAGSATVYVVRP